MGKRIAFVNRKEQHTYLTSDDGIKKDDIVYIKNLSEGIIGKVVSITDALCEVDCGWSTTQTKVLSDVNKIIATTDGNLHRKKVYRQSGKGETLHQDSKGTYEWVIVQNKFPKVPKLNDGIDMVLVEYDENDKPILNSNDEIVVHLIKNNWIRKEVFILMYKSILKGMTLDEPTNDIESISLDEDISKWINEFLNSELLN